MPKADPSHNYYVDLEVSEKADTEEIKRSYRKLARQWHPDRNPGKENEVVPRFQAIQTAQEILTDPEIRAKYDSDRRKRASYRASYQPANTRYASNPTAHPPRTSARPPRPDFTASAASSGANRFSHFPRQPQQSSAQADAEARANAYNAWQNLGARKQQQQQQQSQPQPQPQPQQQAPPQSHPQTGPFGAKPKVDEEKLRQQRTAWEQFKKSNQFRKSTGQPPTGTYQANTAKTPKKPAFDPKSPSANEAQNRNRTSYFHTVPEQPNQSQTGPQFTRAPPPTAKKPGQDFLRPKLNTDVPYFEGEPRLSTPYASNSGEKTYFSGEAFRRSASHRDPNRRPDINGNVFAQAASRPSTASSTRARSASPKRRSSYPTQHANSSKPQSPSPSTNAQSQPHNRGRAGAKFYMSSSDDSEEKLSGDANHKTQSSDTAESLDQRRKARPSPSWAKSRTKSADRDAADTPLMPNGSYTPGMQQKSNSSMYDPFLSSSNDWAQYWPFGPTMSAEGVAPKPPSWAYPSSVLPPTFQVPSTDCLASEMQNNEGYAAFARYDDSEGDPDDVHMHLSDLLSRLPTSPRKDTDPFDSSSFDYQPKKSTANASPNGKSKSSENMAGKFSTSDWNGKFNGDTFAHRPATSNVANTSAKSQTPFPSSTQEKQNPFMANNFNVPPPPPNPPPVKSGLAFPPAPGEVKFSAKEWAQTLKDPSWVYPKPPMKSTSPIRKSTNRSRAPSKSTTTRPATVPKPATVNDPAEDPTAHSNGNEPPENEASDGSAMDIDVEEPKPNAREPRIVNVPPIRHDWRNSNNANSASNSEAEKSNGGISLAGFGNVAPFAPSKSGLKNLQDLQSNLPFDSQASVVHPRRAVSQPQSAHLQPSATTSPASLPLPAPPKAPPAPAPLTPQSWRTYVGRMQAYLTEWNRFEQAITSHFTSRQTTLDTILCASSTAWLEGGTDDAKGGCDAYVQELRQDEQVREHWCVASDSHRETMMRFLSVRERVFQEGL